MEVIVSLGWLVGLSKLIYLMQTYYDTSLSGGLYVFPYSATYVECYSFRRSLRRMSGMRCLHISIFSLDCIPVANVPKNSNSY